MTAPGPKIVLRPQYLRVRNWEKFQHYKDRRPPWIKLYVELCDDYAFTQLSDAGKYHLIGVLLLAARTDNKIPNDPLWVQSAISAKTRVDLVALIDGGYLVPWKQASGGKAKWPSRYIAKEMRADILERDLHQCRECSSTDRLEIDHILPVSRGGESTADNLQVLCRPCNRAKRAKLSAEQVATQMGDVSVGQRQRQRRGREETQDLSQNPLKAVDFPSYEEQRPETASQVRTQINDSLGGAA